MKKYLLPLLLAFAVVFTFHSRADAQSLGESYQTGVGVKLGYWGGGALDIKYFMKPDAALEGLLSFGSHWVTITGLYEFHGPVTGAPGLLWYVGPGAHIGFWNSHYRTDKDYSGGAFFGVDGVVGLDYKFNGAPIDLSLDIQPAVSIPGGLDVWGGLGIRFTF